MNEYGLWSLPFVIILAFIVWLHEVGWKQRDERKLLNYFKEEAKIAGDNPDEVLHKLIMDYVNKKHMEHSKRISEQMERIRSES